jgi:hypothetical protein
MGRSVVRPDHAPQGGAGRSEIIFCFPQFPGQVGVGLARLVAVDGQLLWRLGPLLDSLDQVGVGELVELVAELRWTACLSVSRS